MFIRILHFVLVLCQQNKVVYSHAKPDKREEKLDAEQDENGNAHFFHGKVLHLPGPHKHCNRQAHHADAKKNNEDHQGGDVRGKRKVVAHV